MIIKVCGITDPEQLNKLNSIGFDMVGFNYYHGSPRYVDMPITADRIDSKRVGVFVNAYIKEIIDKISGHSLDLVQLHGDESPELCKELSKHKPVIKAFGIDDKFDFKAIRPYVDYVEYFLFDTKSKNYGGSGRRFNWEKLREYNLAKPFLLSGGIRLDDIPEILIFNHTMLAGIDVNSGFEISPGNKNVSQLEELNKMINNEKSR